MSKNVKYRVLGIMSGTSLDGIDLAICSFSKTKNWQFSIEKAITLPYNKYWKETLQNLHSKSAAEIKLIDKKYGVFIGNTINTFLANEKVDFITSHGHTIFHQPENKYTLQIGDGEVIAKITRTTIINDFRSLDISLSGQGAPLVPIGDLHLFSNYKYCINLGGFSNISIKNNEVIIAFDICPVNIVLNKVCQQLEVEYDNNGDIAKRGRLIPILFEQLNSLNFYNQKAPKSLSREWVEKNIYPLLKNYKPEDILNTFCEHIAIQIGIFLKNDSALFTGGGVFNTYLINRIKYHSYSKIIIPDSTLINFKESLLFAFLGVLRIENQVNCLQSVTGAKRDNCGGVIHHPY
ncbi:MAG TPA: anhydro-N-acetylmuramic acid kinase [Flavobacteriales bacterium]|nr:anhydro-N-acetylmuramic acid kinase [Flavobacteriales bacterium]